MAAMVWDSTQWATAQFDTCELGDRRRNKRLMQLAKQIIDRPEASTPEQTETWGDLKGAYRLFDCDDITPEALLEPRRANMLVALAQLRGTIGIAACDVSTGAMVLEECVPEMLGAALARMAPSEVVVPEDWAPETADCPEGAILRPRTTFASDPGAERLKALHGVATLDAFGAFSRAMLAAAA